MLVSAKLLTLYFKIYFLPAVIPPTFIKTEDFLDDGTTCKQPPSNNPDVLKAIVHELACTPSVLLIKVPLATLFEPINLFSLYVAICLFNVFETPPLLYFLPH